MSTNGTFTIEDCDIARLDGREDGEGAGRERSGWVNVGAFQVFLNMDSAGNLAVTVEPLGAAGMLGYVTASHADAIKMGATDPDAVSEDDIAEARDAGYGVHRSDWTATGGVPGASYFVTTPDTSGHADRLPDDYGSEADAWADAVADMNGGLVPKKRTP